MTENLLPNPKVFRSLRESFASGYLEEPNASPMRRWSRAVQRRLEDRTLAPYNGELLYPWGFAHVGKENRIVEPSYSFTWSYKESALMEQHTEATKEEQEALMALQMDMRGLGAIPLN